jgi:cell division protein FtsN
MNLYKDIYQLISENDCVIIPGFGGFVANYFDAKADLRTQEFCPPMRKIAFNQNLQNNDGLLNNYICTNYNLNWEDARNYVSKFVREIDEKLDNKQILVFDKLGSFAKISDAIVFTPNQNLRFFDDSYGLISFNFPLLKNEKGFVELQKNPVLSKTKQAKYNQTKKNRKPIMYLVSAAAVVGGFIFFSLQFGLFENKNNGSTEYATISPVNISSNDKKDVDNAAAKKENTSNNIAENVEKIESVDVNIVEKTTVTNVDLMESGSAQTHNSFVIAGSFSNIENAQNLQFALNAQGFNAEILPNSNGMHRVSVKSFIESNQAIEELQNLRTQTGNQSLWVLNL